jgi:curved DNA-binding protein CbpA
MPMIKNYYDILGLLPDCTSKAIREAHLQLSILMDNQEVFKSPYLNQYQKNIDEAYKGLMDADVRKEHDRLIFEPEKIITNLRKENKGLNQKIENLNLRVAQEEEKARQFANHINYQQERIDQLTKGDSWVIIIRKDTLRAVLFFIIMAILLWAAYQLILFLGDLFS